METGSVVENPNFRGFMSNNYPAVENAPREQLLALMAAEDKFEANLPVFTFDDETGEVVEKLCEVYGWPNVTHCGLMMYENVFFRSRDDAADAAKSRLQAVERSLVSIVSDMESKLMAKRADLSRVRAIMAARGWECRQAETDN